MQLGTLSSNWKTLQKTLKSGSAQGSDSRKRKATNAPTAANPHGLDGVKKPKIRSAPAQRRTARRNMIADNLATEASEGLSTTPGSQRAPDNDISNVAMARASTTSTRLVHSDRPNEGLSESLSSQLGKYLALDCEMVGVGGPGTAERSVLARASIVDWHGRQVYDSYVRPREPVTDWRTAVSGVDMWHMKEAREFEEVQRDVADLLEGRILVGHAVRHDLAALLLPHPQRDIRDTARHPAFRKLSAGRTPALKRLAREILGLEIQGGQHSSIEDARACISLFRMHKDAFEVEHTRHYPLQPAPADKGDTLAEGGNRTKKRKKKKMKGKR